MKEEFRKGHLRALILTRKDKDLYEILGVDKDTTLEEIKSVFLQLARKFHPDINPEDPESKKRFKPIYNAYRILSNIKKRKMYDKFLLGAFDYEKYLPRRLFPQEPQYALRDLGWKEFMWIFMFIISILIMTIATILLLEYGVLIILGIFITIIVILLSVVSILTLIFGERYFEC